MRSRCASPSAGRHQLDRGLETAVVRRFDARFSPGRGTGTHAHANNPVNSCVALRIARARTEIRRDSFKQLTPLTLVPPKPGGVSHDVRQQTLCALFSSEQTSEEGCSRERDAVCGHVQ